MKMILTLGLMVTLAVSAFAAGDDAGADNAGGAAVSPDAKYSTVIDQRSQKIVQSLGLSDTNVAAKVHDIIMAQYRTLNDWHTANDPKIKAAKHDQAAIATIRSSLQTLHDGYLAGLAQYLTPAQVERIKDAMTYGKVQFTFNGYCSQYPELSETNKQEILRMLKDAREEAMDAGSAKDKTAVFQRYKGKINNYLSKQGITWDQKKVTSSISPP
jgi:hypothetical protein